MSPRKSRQDSSEANEYETSLAKLCREKDVLVIPTVRKIASALDVRNWTRKTPEAAAQPASELDSEELCPGTAPPPPPTVHVAYDRESPVAVVCKAFYVEYALVRAVFASLTTFSTIVTLKIEDCCVSREIVSMLADLLADHPGKSILDLSLDGNSDVAEELPSLLQTELKYLSLRRCSLDDAGKNTGLWADFTNQTNLKFRLTAVKLLARELCYNPDREQNLLALNLNMNLIGDEGALALATALRTNRTLISLSLCGNRITDEGACHLAEALGKFRLKKEEISFRRRRVFDHFLLRKSIMEKLMDDWRTRNEAESLSRIGSSEKAAGKRTRASEIALRRASTSSRDKKRANSTRMSSREMARGKRKSSGVEGSNLSLEPSLLAMQEMKMRAESETPPDGHPFASEVSTVDSSLWCDGCWSLGNLNLSHNRITEQSIDKFLAAIYHRDSFPSYRGLHRLIIQPGNPIPENSPKLAELECTLKNLFCRKVNPSDGSAGGRDQTESVSRSPSLPKKK